MSAWKRCCFSVLLALSVMGVCTLAASKISELEESLETTRRSLVKARKHASDIDKEMFKFKDRAVYSNPALKEMYLKMKALEKELLLQRERVDNEIMKLPEYREILGRRNDAYKAVRDLSNEEDFILVQLKSARSREGSAE